MRRPAQVLGEKFGIVKGTMTTTHSYTGDHNLCVSAQQIPEPLLRAAQVLGEKFCIVKGTTTIMHSHTSGHNLCVSAKANS